MIQERILCAAIYFPELETPRYSVVNKEAGLVMCGHRHAHIIHQFICLTGKRFPEQKYEQGFLTNTNRFIGREEAKGIAITSGQHQRLETINQSDLFSEDLY